MKKALLRLVFATSVCALAYAGPLPPPFASGNITQVYCQPPSSQGQTLVWISDASGTSLAPEGSCAVVLNAVLTSSFYSNGTGPCTYQLDGPPVAVGEPMPTGEELLTYTFTAECQ